MRYYSEVLALWEFLFSTSPNVSFQREVLDGYTLL